MNELIQLDVEILTFGAISFKITAKDTVVLRNITIDLFELSLELDKK